MYATTAILRDKTGLKVYGHAAPSIMRGYDPLPANVFVEPGILQSKR